MTGSMATPRPVATLLQNGQVLAFGGSTGNGETFLTSAELYNPASGKWTATGSMTTARSAGGFTTTPLKDGEVLIAGGRQNASSSALASAELYNPATGTFSPTGSMTEAHEGGTATLLPDGEVLIAGGLNSTGTLSKAELYDPATGTFSPTGSMATARFDHTATLLQNGEVLVAGGENSTGFLFSAELYNPATGTWTATGNESNELFGAHAVLLANGEVFEVGNGGITELYNPATGSWSPGAKFGDRSRFSVTLLATGKVLVAGGQVYTPRPTHFVASALLYDPTTGTFSATGAMNTARAGQIAVLLQSGQVLVGGGTKVAPFGSAELYQP
jgi:hypothetical protein